MGNSLDIILASNRPSNLQAFLQHHGAHHNVAIYVVVDDPLCEKIAYAHGANVVQNPRADLGYYGLHHGYQKALERSRGSFITILNDEIHYPDGWHTILQEEMARGARIFPDMIFRLRPSEFRARQYKDIRDCIRCPENYSIAPRKWYELAGGIGDFWGSDSWHQCIEHYLAALGFPRGVIVDGFGVTGTKAGEGITLMKDREARAKRIRAGWADCASISSRIKYAEAATNLMKGIRDYGDGKTADKAF